MTLRDLWRDERGVTIVEFAIIAPVLLITILGMFDMGYNLYVQTILKGAVQKAARDSTIEGADANSAAIDAAVSSAVHGIAANAQVSFSRKAYSTFGDVGQPEDFSDLNGDGACDEGEPFEDANRNGSWDPDRGREGTGSARDAVLYIVTIRYPRAFPIGRLIGISDTFSTDAETVLRNQPYAANEAQTAVGNCA